FLLIRVLESETVPGPQVVVADLLVSGNCLLPQFKIMPDALMHEAAKRERCLRTGRNPVMVDEFEFQGTFAICLDCRSTQPHLSVRTGKRAGRYLPGPGFKIGPEVCGAALISGCVEQVILARCIAKKLPSRAGLWDFVFSAQTLIHWRAPFQFG